MKWIIITIAITVAAFLAARAGEAIHEHGSGEARDTTETGAWKRIARHEREVITRGKATREATGTLLGWWQARRTATASLPAGSGRYLAVKTNAAAWAITALNAAIEIQVARRVTVDVPLAWCPWHISSKHAARFLLLQPEARLWLDRPGGGLFAGIHAHAGWFNVKWKRDRYQDTSRPLLGAGVSLGYAVPLGGRWAAEFSVGGGYANMKYDTYYNIPNGAHLDSRSRDYWGITRLGINLVYNFNIK